MYIVCALWINTVGHLYDACLSPAAYGSRLRRLRSDHADNTRLTEYHLHAPGSFQPYYYCYKEWRETGLEAIRRELAAGSRVVAITMDLASFYHSIDARFLLHDYFLALCSAQSPRIFALSSGQREFTADLIRAFKAWSEQTSLPSNSPPGVPVGPSAPRVIANVLLLEFDLAVQTALSPVYYGRYVDDIFIVFRDSGAFATPHDVLNHLTSLLPQLQLASDRSELQLKLPYAETSRLRFQTTKQRIFLLAGEVGQDLLDTIKGKIDEVSSEWRFLPDIDELERSPAARVLTASKNSHEEPDSLRKADALSLRRLSFALMLRGVDALSRDLPPSEWSDDRKRFYGFVNRHVITPLRILDLNDYLPRLLALAIACHDWDDALLIVRRVREVLRNIRDHVESSHTGDNEWNGYAAHLELALTQAVYCSYPLNAGNRGRRLVRSVLSEIAAMTYTLIISNDGECERQSRRLLWCDLARTPFKDLLLEPRSKVSGALEIDLASLPHSQRDNAIVILEFLSEMNAPGTESLAPLLFPTRPLTAPEVTECVPSTVVNLLALRRYVHALRGTWVLPVGDLDNIVVVGDTIEVGKRHE